MIYYEDDEVTIRDFEQSDVAIITREEIAQGWNSTVEHYENRLKDRSEGKCISLAAEYKGNVAGYLNVYPNSTWGAFANRGYADYCNDDDLNLYFSKKA